MGKGMRPTKFQDSNKISENMEVVKENERVNPSMKFDSHKEVKKNKDGSTRFIY